MTLRRKGKRIGTVRGPGGVGFLAYLARQAGGTSAVAESFVEALEVRGDAMDEVLEDHFAVLLGHIRWAAERLIALGTDGVITDRVDLFSPALPSP